MSERLPPPAPATGPTPKTIAVVFVIACSLMLLGFAIDASARSKDEGIGAILPTMLGLLLFVVDFILFLMWAIRRKQRAASD